MSTNKNMQAAKKAKNDEFYTAISDIEAEVNNYWEQLKGEVVYCPCDDYRWSKFVEYFKTNFSKIGLKKLIATNYDIGDGAWKYTYDGISETIEQLKGDGDFESEECTKIKNSEATIIITNPPFSKFRTFFQWMYDENKNT